MYTAADVSNAVKSARLANSMMIDAIRNAKQFILSNHPSADSYLEETDEHRRDRDSYMASARLMKRSVAMQSEIIKAVDEAMDRPGGIAGLRVEVTSGKYIGDIAVVEHRSLSQSDNMYIVAQIEGGEYGPHDHYGLIILFDGEYKLATE